MKNWIKIGGIAGIILIIAFILSRYSSVVPGLAGLPIYISIFLGQLLYFLPIFIYLGFMFAAKKNDKRFLKIVSLLLVVSSAVFFVYYLVSTILFYSNLAFLNMRLMNTHLNSYVGYAYMAISSITGILELLFGIGLITFRKINKFAFITGIVILADFVMGMLLSGFIMVSLPPGEYTLPYYYHAITFLFNLGIILLETIILINLDKNSKKEKINKNNKKRKK